MKITSLNDERNGSGEMWKKSKTQKLLFKKFNYLVISKLNKKAELCLLIQSQIEKQTDKISFLIGFWFLDSI